MRLCPGSEDVECYAQLMANCLCRIAPYYSLENFVVQRSISCEGHGVIMGGESEMATFRGEGFGRISSSGSVKWRGSHFYRTTASSGKLAFLNNAVGVFEVEIDQEGNFTEKIWEWK